MLGGTPGTYSSWLIAWGAGIVIFGLVLAYVAIRIRPLRRSERERLDRATQSAQHVEEMAEAQAARPDFGYRRNVPYALIVPIVVVCFAIVLMIWAFYGTTGPNQQSSLSRPQATTTGQAPARQTNQAVQAPVTPGNDAESDSARGGQAPLNKSR
jgi:amino acid transporter